jgi:hypothetical protein
LALADWSSVADDNTTTLGVNIAEGCPAANVNNALRKAMADVAGGVNVSLLGTFLASTTLAQARTALGVTEGSASQTAFAALTNAANLIPYMTGSDAWATTSLTSFARTVLDDGDAATARTTLGALGLTSASFGSNTIDVRVSLGNGDTLVLKGGTGTLGGDSTATLSYGVTFSSAPVVIVSGGPSDTASEGSVHNYGTPGTTSASIINTSGLTNTYTWLALGKLA